jgi:hypothetical protein
MVLTGLEAKASSTLFFVFSGLPLQAELFEEEVFGGIEI